MTGTFTFLGTGTSQGIPMPACGCSVCQSTNPKDKRLRSSALIEIDNRTICIDTGPDFRYQMIRENVKRLDAIIYTHEHRDHVAGLDDVRAFNYVNKEAMPIFAPSEVIKALKSGYQYIFESNYPGIPKVNLHEITENAFTIMNLPFIPIPVWHHKLRVFGYRIGDIAYITDAKTVPESSKELIHEIPTLVINCLHESPHISHFNLKEALAFIEEIKPNQAYLTHISHLFGYHDEIKAKLPSNVYPAHDGLKLNFNL
jgi:phosphoribosyl 1,2-cyclic phosphate phosphodiesterase